MRSESELGAATNRTVTAGVLDSKRSLPYRNDNGRPNRGARVAHGYVDDWSGLRGGFNVHGKRAKRDELAPVAPVPVDELVADESE